MNRSRSIRRPEVVDSLADERRGTIFLVAVIVAVFVGALDQTVIVTVLPAVVSDLEIPFDRIDQAAWVVSGYLLGYTIALPLMGRFADLRGRRLSLALGLGAFALGSAGCAFAGTLGALVAARIVQAAGGGALLPVAIAVISDRYPSHRRALAIGLVGAVAEAGGVLGPLYGAAIVHWLTWRWIFWLNIPIALVLLLGTRLGDRENQRVSGRIDLPGAATIALALALLVVGLSHASVLIGSVDVRRILIGLSIVTFAAFVVYELRSVEPLLDLRTLRRPGFTSAIIGGILLGGALIVAMVDVPLYAATVRGSSAAEGGLLLMRLTALIPVGAILGGVLGTRGGLSLPTGLGFLVAGLGLGAMSRWGASPTESYLWLSLGLTGLGFGLLIAPLSTAAVNNGGTGREASAAAMFTVARLLGMTVGLSILTAWGLRRFDELAKSIPLPLPRIGQTAVESQRAMAEFNSSLLLAGAEVYREIFLAAAGVSLLGIVVALWLRFGSAVGRSAR